MPNLKILVSGEEALHRQCQSAPPASDSWMEHWKNRIKDLIKQEQWQSLEIMKNFIFDAIVEVARDCFLDDYTTLKTLIDKNFIDFADVQDQVFDCLEIHEEENNLQALSVLFLIFQPALLEFVERNIDECDDYEDKRLVTGIITDLVQNNYSGILPLALSQALAYRNVELFSFLQYYASEKMDDPNLRQELLKKMLYADTFNHGSTCIAFLERCPLDSILSVFASIRINGNQDTKQNVIGYILRRINTSLANGATVLPELSLELAKSIMYVSNGHDKEWLQAVFDDQYQNVVVHEAVDGIFRQINANILETLTNLKEPLDPIKRASQELMMLTQQNKLLPLEDFLATADSILLGDLETFNELKCNQDSPEYKRFYNRFSKAFEFLQYAHYFAGCLSGQHWDSFSESFGYLTFRILSNTINDRYQETLSEPNTQHPYYKPHHALLRQSFAVCIQMVQFYRDEKTLKEVVCKGTTGDQARAQYELFRKNITSLLEAFEKNTNHFRNIKEHIEWEKCAQDITKGLAPRRRVIPEIARNATERELARRNTASPQSFSAR